MSEQRPTIGIYSGAFDPVHAGHINFALTATKEARLQTVYIMPEPNPRSHQHIVSIEHRLAMIELATARHANISVLPPVDAQFTINTTLPKLVDRFPNCKVALLIGSDVVPTFSHRWPGLIDLLQSVDIIIGLRGKDTRVAVRRQMEALREQVHVTARYAIVATQRPHAAATLVRQGKHDMADLDPAVAAYITEHSLY